MPGDLSDPEQLYPYHYDPRYEVIKNPYDSGVLSDLDGIIQNISQDIQGKPMSSEKLKKMKEDLESSGSLIMNPGDSDFKDKVITLLKKQAMIERVAYARFK